jgi:phosphoribosylformimino-5-aminoimidazole carboxamide ribonucleotide (ProFAR) isomerase
MGGIVAGRDIALYPFCGFPQGHPTRLGGSPEDIARHCREMVAAGAAGVDLLAYRATDAAHEDLIRAARAALPQGRLIVAGSIASPERVRAMANLQVDAITIGTALFQGNFAPGRGGVAGQLKAALEALP